MSKNFENKKKWFFLSRSILDEHAEFSVWVAVGRFHGNMTGWQV